MLRTLTQAEIEEVLTGSTLGRIGCRQGDKIYIIPVSYVYEGGTILCRSYEGVKVAIMREQPDVCFEVEWLSGFHEWKTVLCWGRFEELREPADLAFATERLSYRQLEQKASLSSRSPAEFGEQHHGSAPATVVYYRIRPLEFSGRYQKELPAG